MALRRAQRGLLGLSRPVDCSHPPLCSLPLSPSPLIAWPHPCLGLPLSTPSLSLDGNDLRSLPSPPSSSSVSPFTPFSPAFLLLFPPASQCGFQSAVVGDVGGSLSRQSLLSLPSPSHPPLLCSVRAPPSAEGAERRAEGVSVDLSGRADSDAELRHTEPLTVSASRVRPRFHSTEAPRRASLRRGRGGGNTGEGGEGGAAQPSDLPLPPSAGGTTTAFHRSLSPPMARPRPTSLACRAVDQ